MKSLNKSLLLFTMFISLLFITSCSGLFNSNSKSGDNESGKEYIISGNVTTDFRGAIPEILSEKLNDSRSALPGKPSVDFFYKVMAFKERDYSYPDPAVCESTSNDGTFVLKIREPGTYKIACSVYHGSDENGILFFSGEDTVILSEDHPYNNEVELIASVREENLNGSNLDSLTYRYGDGGLFNLYLYAENSTGVNSLKYKYKHTVLNGTESEGEGLKSVDAETGNIRFLINEEVSNAGVHTLTLDFYDAAECLVYSCKEMMTIFNNCETNTWYDPSVENSAPYLQFDDTTKTFKFLLTNELVAKFQNSVFYVGGTGASDENAGTNDKPFATVQKAVDEIQLINDEKTEYMIYLLGDVTDETDSDYSADNNRSLVNLASTKALKVTISSFGTDGEGNPNCYKINANRSFDGSNGTQGRVINVAGDYNRDGTAKNSSKVQLILENVEICGGRLGGNGAGIIVDYNGTLILNDGAIVKNNISIGAYYGGGIELANVTATTGKETPVFVMNGGKVTENSSGSYGGGISAYTGSFTMNGGEISNNTLTGNNLTNEDECGAGVYLDCEKAAFNGGKILNNSIADDKNGNTYGTGVYVKAGTDFSITGSRETVYISGNSCENLEVSSIKGTGIYFEERTDSNSPVSIKNAVIYGNVSSLNNTITENFGAGMYLNGGTFSFENVTISNNKNAKNGIGLYIGGSGTVNAIKNVQIINNISENSTVASDGCGVFINAGTFNFSDGIISGNSSTIAGNGKGVYNDDKFIISGLAKVDESNDVYLPNGKKIKIGNKLLNSGIAGVITCEAPVAGLQVLEESTSGLMGSNYEKFLESTAFFISNEGKLVPPPVQLTIGSITKGFTEIQPALTEAGNATEQATILVNQNFDITEPLTLTIQNGTTVTLANTTASKVYLYRKCTGDLITVDAGAGSFNLEANSTSTCLYIDGKNSDFADAGGSLIKVTSGNVNLVKNVYLQNNYNTSGNGGGLYIEEDASCNIASGTSPYNTFQGLKAQNGGAIYCKGTVTATGSIYYFSGSSNRATEKGNLLYLAETGNADLRNTSCSNPAKNDYYILADFSYTTYSNSYDAYVTIGNSTAKYIVSNNSSKMPKTSYITPYDITDTTTQIVGWTTGTDLGSLVSRFVIEQTVTAGVPLKVLNVNGIMEDSISVNYDDVTSTLSVSGSLTQESMAPIKAYLNSLPEGTVTLDLSESSTMYEFGKCKAIKKVILPKDITSIPSSCFSGCEKLEDVDFSNCAATITELGSSAFADAKGLKEIDLTVLTNLTTINNDCFRYNTSLITAKIPASVTFIDGQNFMQCTNLKDVWIYGSYTKYDPCSSHTNTGIFNKGTVTSCEFAHGDPDLTIHIPASAESFYRNSDNGWTKWEVLFETY